MFYFLEKFISLFFILAVLFGMVQCTYPMRAFIHLGPSPNDFKVFHADKIAATSATCLEPFVEAKDFPIPPAQEWIMGDDFPSDMSLEEVLEATNTYAFIVLRNDSILYEQYFNGYSNEAPKVVFSLAKVLTTSLVDIAIQENYIESQDQKVANFLPCFNENEVKSNITLSNVLNMTSGLNYDEYGNVFRTGRFYYSKDLACLVEESECPNGPAQEFVYKSIDSQVLGMCVEQVMENPIHTIIENKLVKDMDFCEDILFTYDQEEGNERMFGGLAISARDLLKFGYVFMNGGKNWDGKKIISEDWIKQLQTRDTTDGKWWGYKNGWWQDTFIMDSFLEDSDFYASGYNGQRLYVNPTEKLVMVRLGRNKGGVFWSPSMGQLAHQINGHFKDEEETKETKEDKETKEEKELMEFDGIYTHQASNSSINLERLGKGREWVVKSQQGIFNTKRFKMKQYCSKSFIHSNELLRFLFPEASTSSPISYLIYDDGKGGMWEFVKTFD